MDPQHLLITVYDIVCQAYKHVLQYECQRFSNNKKEPLFTDQEVMTIFLFGILRRRFQLKEIFDYIQDYWRVWFPCLTTYSVFVRRLNRLSPCFMHLAPILLYRLQRSPQYQDVVEWVKLLDAMPIVMAKGSRASQAMVAQEIAAKGGHSSILGGFYGVKIHAIGQRRREKMPLPELMLLTPGNIHDSVVLASLEDQVRGFELYADKAYIEERMKESLAMKNVVLHTPVKKVRGRTTDLHLDERLYSTAVSRVRQPIESFFNWLQQHTQVQLASKVRSTQGLYVHVFGRICAALLLLLNP
jgi:hypothetical protein